MFVKCPNCHEYLKEGRDYDEERNGLELWGYCKKCGYGSYFANFHLFEEE